MSMPTIVIVQDKLEHGRKVLVNIDSVSQIVQKRQRSGSCEHFLYLEDGQMIPVYREVYDYFENYAVDPIEELK